MWRWPRNSNRPIPFRVQVILKPSRSEVSSVMNFSTILLDLSEHLLEKYGWYRAFQLRLFDRNMGTLPWVKIFHGSYSCTKVTALEKQMAPSKFQPCHKFRKNMDETDKALLGTQENDKINLDFPGISLFVRGWVRQIIMQGDFTGILGSQGYDCHQLGKKCGSRNGVWAEIYGA